MSSVLSLEPAPHNPTGSPGSCKTGPYGAETALEEICREFLITVQIQQVGKIMNRNTCKELIKKSLCQRNRHQEGIKKEFYRIAFSSLFKAELASHFWNQSLLQRNKKKKKKPGQTVRHTRNMLQKCPRTLQPTHCKLPWLAPQKVCVHTLPPSPGSSPCRRRRCTSRPCKTDFCPLSKPSRSHTWCDANNKHQIWNLV